MNDRKWETPWKRKREGIAPSPRVRTEKLRPAEQHGEEERRNVSIHFTHSLKVEAMLTEG